MPERMLPEGTIDKKKAWYQKHRKRLIEFVGDPEIGPGELTTTIEKLLKKHKISTINIEYRVKKWDSLENKIKKNRTDLDICGCRVVVRINEDVDRVCKLLQSYFDVCWDQTEDKRLYGRLNHKKKFEVLGYEAVHYIISINKERAKIPEWKKFKKYFAEVQVRTALQDSWARVSHAWGDYKPNSSSRIPADCRRKLMLASGMLENVDYIFSEINKQHLVHSQDIEIRPYAQIQAVNENLARDIFNDLLRTIKKFHECPSAEFQDELNDWFDDDVLVLASSYKESDLVRLLAVVYKSFCSMVLLWFCDSLLIEVEGTICEAVDQDVDEEDLEDADLVVLNKARFNLRFLDTKKHVMKCMLTSAKINNEFPSDIDMKKDNNITAALQSSGIARCSDNRRMHQPTPHSASYDDYITLTFGEEGRGSQKRCWGSVSVDVRGDKVYMLDEMIKLGTFSRIRSLLSWGLDRVKRSMHIDGVDLVASVLSSGKELVDE